MNPRPVLAQPAAQRAAGVIAVAGDICDIVGWYDIDDAMHRSWATVPPRTTGG